MTPSSPNPHRKSTPPTPAERFWSKVDKDGPVCVPELGPCWMWTAGTQRGGYGCIRVSGKHVGAHRLVWELHFGQIPPGQWVLHRCDNPPCVRPSHLFLGTSADNQRDCVAKGRHSVSLEQMLQDVMVAPWKALMSAGGPRVAFGESHYSAKLTTAQVEAIRRRYIPHRVSTYKLAKEFGVSRSAISDVLSGKHWKRG